MNKRIKELADKCWAEMAEVDPDMRYSQRIDEFTENFAELIIKECTTILLETDFSYELSSEMNTVNNGAELGATAIEEHFGVE